MARRKRKGRSVPPDPRPQITPAELTDLLSSHAGLVVMHYAHDPHCPAGRSGLGIGCTCKDGPEITIRAPFGLRPRQEGGAS